MVGNVLIINEKRMSVSTICFLVHVIKIKNSIRFIYGGVYE